MENRGSGTRLFGFQPQVHNYNIISHNLSLSESHTEIIFQNKSNYIDGHSIANLSGIL